MIAEDQVDFIALREKAEAEYLDSIGGQSFTVLLPTTTPKEKS